MGFAGATPSPALHPPPTCPEPPLQSLSYASPKALLNALLPQAQLPAQAPADEGRVAAFKRYIAGL